MFKRSSNPKMYFCWFISAMLLLGILLSATACSKESQGENLVIPISEVTETAKFYSVNINGTEMEVIAVKDSTGNIRTAFNTCQICYDSGRGYYKQDGNSLICQNCGNRFTVNQIEVETGGCNPYPIFDKNKTITEDSITISYEFLEQSRKIFSNWKTSY